MRPDDGKFVGCAPETHSPVLRRSEALVGACAHRSGENSMRCVLRTGTLLRRFVGLTNATRVPLQITSASLREAQLVLSLRVHTWMQFLPVLRKLVPQFLQTAAVIHSVLWRSGWNTSAVQNPCFELLQNRPLPDCADIFYTSDWQPLALPTLVRKPA